MNEKLEVMNQESPKKFGCNVCDFLCDKFSKFQIHKSTTKHKERVRFGENHKNINENENGIKNENTYNTKTKTNMKKQKKNKFNKKNKTKKSKKSNFFTMY